MDTATIGYQTFTVNAIDNAGNDTTQAVEFVVNATGQTTTPGANVPATLALSLGTAPDVRHRSRRASRATYTASTIANVVSTAGDGLLSVSDASSPRPAGSSTARSRWPQPIQARAASAGGTGGALAAVGGSAAPTSLLTYSAPKSNDAVTLSFSQAVGQNEALRSGTYSKALTFTLSTTTP